MSVNGAKVAKLQGFKQVGTAAYHAFKAFHQLMAHGPAEVFAHRQFAHQFPYIVLYLIISWGSGNIGQVFFQCAYIGVNADTIIIQDDQHIGICHAGMVHGFKSHPGGHGAIADHGHGLAIGFALVLGRYSHAQGSRNGSGGMPYPECIVLAFTSFWKAAQAIVFAVGNKIIAAPGQDLVPVSLVAHVPYQLIIRRIIHVMKCRCQFHHPQAGAEMTSMHTYHINNVLS